MDTSIGKIIDDSLNIKFEEDKNDNVLDARFLPLENNFSFVGSNFSFFAKIMEIIDPSIIFMTGMKCDYKENIITIPSLFKYRDIPDLVRVIKEKLKSNALDIAFLDIKNDYEDKAYYFLKYSFDSNQKEIYKVHALKLFTISCLFSGISDVKEIEKLFSELTIFERKNDVIGKEVEIYVRKNHIQNSLKTNSIKGFKIGDEDRKKLASLAIKDKSEFVKQYELILFKYIDSFELNEKELLKTIISSMIRTKVRVNEIMIKTGIDSFKEIQKDIEEFIKGYYSNTTSSIDKLKSDLDKQILLGLKNDFEKGIYYAMSKDINPKLKKNIKDSIVESTDVFVDNIKYNPIGYIESLVLFSYLDEHFKEKELNSFYELLKKGKKPFPNIELISLLPGNHKNEILELQQKYLEIYNSLKFKEILLLIISDKFLEVKDKINYLNDDMKIDILYLLFFSIQYDLSHSIMRLPKKNNSLSYMFSSSFSNPTVRELTGERRKLVNTVLYGGDFLKNEENPSVYMEKNSEIKHLKKDVIQINCMGMSVVMNYVIEELFGFRGCGISIFKQGGEVLNHIANGIRFGDKLLFLDLTNNYCFIFDLKKFDKNNYYDICDFPVAYYIGAIDNVGTDIWRDCILNNRFVEYIKSYLDFSGDSSILSKANRNKNKSWNNIETQKFN